MSAGLLMFFIFNSYVNDKYFNERISRITNMRFFYGRVSVFESSANYFIASPFIGTGYKKYPKRE